MDTWTLNKSIQVIVTHGYASTIIAYPAHESLLLDGNKIIEKDFYKFPKTAGQKNWIEKYVFFSVSIQS